LRSARDPRADKHRPVSNAVSVRQVWSWPHYSIKGSIMQEFLLKNHAHVICKLL
jgi:hypothetical protein